MKNLFISVSNPEESRQVSQKLDSLGYNKHRSFRDTESYIKLYKEDKTYNSFDDDSFWGGVCDKMTAAEFLNPAARGLPECFYINVPTESLAQAVRDKLKSLGHVDCCSGSDAKTGRVFSFKDKSFSIHSKDYVVTHPYKITEEVSLDLLFSQPAPPVETEIPGVLTGDYTLFKKENGDFSIRECGKEILTVSAGNMAKIK